MRYIHVYICADGPRATPLVTCVGPKFGRKPAALCYMNREGFFFFAYLIYVSFEAEDLIIERKGK